SVTIAAAPNPILYGNSVAISGKLTASTPAGVSVTLKAAPYPYTSFVQLATATTDIQGVYQFAQSPKLNTEYRVMAKSKSQATSTTLLVQVRTRVSLRLSTPTPAVGARVRFSGSVTPAHDGQMVLIQRRSRTGTFVTVATATLLHTEHRRVDLPQDHTHQSKRHLSGDQAARCRSSHRRQRTTPNHRSLTTQATPQPDGPRR